MMFQRTQLVRRMRDAEMLRMFMASDMNVREELSASLEVAKKEATEARQTVEAGATLVQEAQSKAAFFEHKADGLETKLSDLAKERQELQQDYDRLIAEKMESDSEVARLKAKLQQVAEMAAAEMAAAELAKVTEATQREVDMAFTYGYRCCLFKHAIEGDSPHVPNGMEFDTVFGESPAEAAVPNHLEVNEQPSREDPPAAEVSMAPIEEQASGEAPPADEPATPAYSEAPTLSGPIVDLDPAE